MTKPYGLRKRLQSKRFDKVALLEYDNYMLNEEKKLLEEFQWDAIKVLTYYYHNRPTEAHCMTQELKAKHECYILTIPQKEDKLCYSL